MNDPEIEPAQQQQQQQRKYKLNSTPLHLVEQCSFVSPKYPKQSSSSTAAFGIHTGEHIVHIEIRT